MKPVAVLGTGPAGLMAAHAVALSGKPVALFGEGKRSRLGGAQFLHDPIPLVNDEEPDTVVEYVVRGSASGYKRKVYDGDPAVPSVSITRVHDGKRQPAWNLIKTYDRLWDLLSADDQNVASVTPQWLDENEDNFELIISSIPGPAICRVPSSTPGQGHTFMSQKVWIANKCILDSLGDNTIVYDGTEDVSWYRCSRLFGVGSTEWPDNGRRLRGLEDYVQVRKPIYTNCNCHPKVVRVGRFGTWTKGVLTNDAFAVALRIMKTGGLF